MQRLPISDPSAVAQARRAIGMLAAGAGFNEEDAGRAALVATEICSNLLKHTGGGELLATAVERAGRSGIELLGLDQGPGMADVAKCLRDGFSTGGSPGTGLGAIQRMSQHFEIYSRPDRGTAVLAVLWANSRTPPPSSFEIGAVIVPKPEETECGDSWCYTMRAGGVLVAVIDGLGHGAGAARASKEACRVFDAEQHQSPGAILRSMHAALRSTRGAAVTLVDIDWSQQRLTTASVGNVIAAYASAGEFKRLASDNGIVGHVVSKVRELQFPCPPDAVLILHSDGLTAGWHPEHYPGLIHYHPTLIAGVLYRDCSRGRDDALVVAAKKAGDS